MQLESGTLSGQTSQKAQQETSYTQPLEPQSLPPELGSTLSNIAGQLDVLVQVSDIIGQLEVLVQASDITG